jgi:hypothetical protein
MNREEFLGFQDLVIEKVHIKAINADLFVRSLSAAEKAAWEQQPLIEDKKNGGTGLRVSKDRTRTARERLVEIAVCNEDGSRFFKDGDAAAIGRKNAATITQLFDVATRLSGITQEDVEEVVKNLDADPDAVSTSA